MSDKKYKVKVGDKLIANDAFNNYGYIEEGNKVKSTTYKMID